jgi:flagellar hook-associated protein 2
MDSEDKAIIDQAGILVGNYAVNTLRSILRNYVGSRALGFSGDNDMYSLYSQVGMKINDSRRIDFDRDLFKQELNTNPDEIVKLFSANKAGSLDNNDFIYMSGTGDTKAGNYEFKVEYNASGDLSYVEYKDRTTGITYNSIGNKDIRINATDGNFTVFAGGARGVAITGAGVPTPGSTHSFSLSIKDGKAKTFEEDLKTLFDENTGLTKVLEKNYEDIIKNIDKRIDREMMRVEQVKKRLELRFATLETNMQNWNGQMERLQQQLAQLQ